MGSVPAELSLDLRPSFVPKTIADFLYDLSTIPASSDKLSRLHDFLSRLEDELRKIDAFKRELPLCMFLLNDAILVLKEESEKCRAHNSLPVLEDNRNGASAFMPFSSYPSVPVTTVALATTKEEKEETVINRLSLLTPGVKTLREGFGGSRGSRTSSNRAVSSSPPTVQPSLRAGPLQQQQQTARKQRRCWSPELHRRFVNALQKLGGSQAATPKQIRELMQVDGLTNDEVKSHLQKYRLHTRRVPAANSNQSVVVLGGLWMSQDQYNDSSKGSSSGSGSPQSPLHLATGSRGGTSPTEGESMEDDEDEKSESYSWKSHIQKAGKVDV
ncbi:SANT/Myb domain [Sesbania bispinosa]|nr:SANT/Myb domain [Sesbania bispinosa]